jgi:hypothetical protein
MGAVLFGEEGDVLDVVVKAILCPGVDGRLVFGNYVHMMTMMKMLH